MKVKVLVETEINVAKLRMCLPVRCDDDEDMPYDFPLRDGEFWSATIDLETDVVEGWPQGRTGFVKDMKVCDGGIYELIDDSGKVLYKHECYVPDFLPGDYGDYIDIEINQNGKFSGINKNELADWLATKMRGDE